MLDITNYFTTQITSGNFNILLVAISFLGGILASISPCSLAMLPIVIGYIGGYGDNDNKKIFGQLLSFVLGSAFIFSIIGVICAVTGQVFKSFAGDYFVLFIASFLLILGLNLTGILDLNFPVLINKIPQNQNNSKFIYPFILGILFALAGTPCSTPILAGIMSFAAISDSIILSVIMLFAFALGQGIILIAAGLFTNLAKKFINMSAFSDIIIKISGWLLILTSLFMYYKVFYQFFV